MYNTDTKVKYILSNTPGSPILEDKFGSLNKLLKTVLTEGFNNKIADSFIKTDLEYAKITLGINHGFFEGNVIEVSGTTENSLNKQYRVLEAGPLDIKIYVGSSMTNTEATSDTDIEVKIAPLGYTIPYENEEEGVICFKNKSLKSPAILKSIDKLPPNGYSESWAKYARVVIGQFIDDKGDFIDNNKSPYWASYPDSEKTGNGVAGASGIHGYAKWDYAIHNNYDFREDLSPQSSRFPTKWKIIGDDRTVYVMIQSMGSDHYSYNILGFGNYIPENKKETFNVCLQARHGPIKANQGWNYCFVRSGNNFGGLDWDYGGNILANIYGEIKNQSRSGIYRTEGLYLSGSNYAKPWASSGINPVLTSGSLLTSPLYLKDSDNYLRGEHRGVNIFYGEGSIESHTSQDYVITTIQSPMGVTNSSGNEKQSLLFSLRDWESVD